MTEHQLLFLILAISGNSLFLALLIVWATYSIEDHIDKVDAARGRIA